jgi:hypothetical protein
MLRQIFVIHKQHVTILLAVFLLSTVSYAQSLDFVGVISDSLLQPVFNATIYSKPISFDENLKFSVSDIKGKFELRLQKSKQYEIVINHLGYYEIVDTIFLNNDTVKNYILKESRESLDEIILNKRLAVSVKKDTITYRTDQFVNGKERKLRDVLKKLPGLDVDREGNVTVNGKEVTKFLVDGKDFFNGDEKLGVNNIPADAVDEVVALDNYTEIPWLKGLSDSDQLALNIKLKDGKKNFVFGDIIVGGGVEDRYVVNPALFYYSPKTSLNFIGDLNNTGNRSFTASDYLDFAVNKSTILDNNVNYSSILRDNVSQTLSNDNFRNLETLFGGLNISHELSNSLNLSAYSLNNNDNLTSENLSEINYLTGNRIVEERTNNSNQQQDLSVNTLKLNYSTVNEFDVVSTTNFKNTKSDVLQLTRSQSVAQSQFADRMSDTYNRGVEQLFQFNKRFSSKHISTLEASIKQDNLDNNVFNLFDQPIFPNALPLITEESGTFSVNQLVSKRTLTINAALKHYWILNNTTHIYPLMGLNINQVIFDNVDRQLLGDGTVNDFESSGFNNDLYSAINDYYVGAQLKKKYGKLIVKPGIKAHLYDWNAQQMDLIIADQSKAVLLPELLLEYEPLNTRKWRLNYSLNSTFNDPQNFANRLRLNAFNQIFQGNETIENTLYHRVSAGYTSFKLLQGTVFSMFLSYNKFVDGVRNTTLIDGINQINTLVQTDLPENSYSANVNYSTYFWNLKWSYRGNVLFSNYSRILNTRINDFESVNVSNTIEVETRFKKWPNFEFELGHRRNQLSGGLLSNSFDTFNSSGLVEWDFLKHFLFQADYDFSYFSNNESGDSNSFNTINTSIEYWKQSTAWKFKLEFMNLLDNSTRITSSVNQFQAIDNTIFVQPRVILLSVTYNL